MSACVHVFVYVWPILVPTVRSLFHQRNGKGGKMAGKKGRKGLHV